MRGSPWVSAAIRSGPPDRVPGAGPLVGERAARVRRVEAGRGAPAADRRRSRAPGAGPLPGDPGPQAGALPGAAALAQARAWLGAFTAAHQGFWARARARLGDSAGTKALIEVLLLHRRMPAAQVTAGITAALAAGSCSPDVVAIEARKHAAAMAGPAEAGQAAWPALRPRPSRAAVVTLPHRAGEPPADPRPAPSVAAYDQLLAAPPAAGEGGG